MKNLLLGIFLVITSLTGYAKTIKLDETNTIPLMGVIGPEMMLTTAIRLEILNQVKTDKPIYFYIYSPGGDVESSEVIIQLAKNSRRPVNTITIAAASAAFNIVQSLGDRDILENSLLLTHNAYQMKFQINEESADRVQKALDYLYKIYNRIAQRLNMTITEYENFMHAETFIRGKNNLIVNTADRIIEIECSKTLLLMGGCGE